MPASEKEKHRIAMRDRMRKRVLNETPEEKAARALAMKQRRITCIAQGICVSCNDLAVARRYCLFHWIACAGRNHGLTVKNGGAEFLKRKWDLQNGVCALTGDKLTPGHNAHLDHIVPLSRGGTNDFSNFQWVTAEANTAKAYLLHTEFVELCRKVIAHSVPRDNVIEFRKVDAS